MPPRNKSCFVSYCKNTTLTTPSKLFVTVPDAEVRRKLWFEAVRREYNPTKTRHFCCEDHFDLQNDMKYYGGHSMMEGKIILKPSVVPHVFNWPESSSIKKLKLEVLTEDSHDYDFGTQTSLGMVNRYQQTSPIEVKSIAINCDLDTIDETIINDATTSPMEKKFVKVEDITSSEATTETVTSSSDFVFPKVCGGSLDTEKSSFKVYLKKDAIPNESLPTSKNTTVNDESNMEILPYMDSSKDQDVHLAMELKQEPDDFFIEEQKFETEDHFFPNAIIEETWKDENDFIQISNEIKKEFVSIKQENDTQETQNIFKEKNIDQHIIGKINFKQELLVEDTLNDESDVIERMHIVSSIKQEINIDSTDLEESVASIKKECNNSDNSYINNTENRLNYPKGKWIRNINLSGPSLKLMNIKNRNPSTGIIICAICGNLYTKQVEFSYHTITKHHLKQKILYETELDQKFAGTPIFNKDENKLKEELLEDNSDEIVDPTASENEFKCEVCLKSFSQKDILNQHLLLFHQGKKRYKCDFCSKSFMYKCNLNKHLLRHTGMKTFRCDICLKSFTRKNSLNIHLLAHTGKKPFNCNVCFKSFIHTGNLNKHMRSHRGEKLFNCEICFKSFSQKCNLKMHMRLHTGETPFKCDVCPKSFPRRDYLDNHVRCHTGGKPFHCDICFKNFTRKDDVVRHLRCHTGEKPFTCKVCFKSFVHKGYLNTHMRCHTGEKAFNCDICSKSFSQKGNLNKHLRLHTGETPFKCDVCPKSFSEKAHLICHAQHHKGQKPFKCEICSKTYSWKSGLNAHISSHYSQEKRFICDICSKCFTRKSSLNRHLYSHTRKKTI